MLVSAPIPRPSPSSAAGTEPEPQAGTLTDASGSTRHVLDRYAGDVSQEPLPADDGAISPSKQIGRFTVPPFVMDLGREPGALAALAAGALALFVAGLDPKVFGPGMPDMQRALRERQGLENLFLLAVVVQAAFYLVGGAAGDIVGPKRVLLVGLAGMVVSEVVAAIWSDGALFLAARVATAASIGLVIPTAIAVVAMAYSGVTRATALGAAYAMLGLSSALAPAILNAVTPRVGRWPAFALVAIIAVLAFVVARRNIRFVLVQSPTGGVRGGARHVGVRPAVPDRSHHGSRRRHVQSHAHRLSWRWASASSSCSWSGSDASGTVWTRPWPSTSVP